MGVGGDERKQGSVLGSGWALTPHGGHDAVAPVLGLGVRHCVSFHGSQYSA